MEEDRLQGVEPVVAQEDVAEIQTPDNSEEVATEEVVYPYGAEAESQNKRPGKRERQHRKEMREMQAQLEILQSMMAQRQDAQPEKQHSADYYGNEQTPDDIQHYVTQAVQATMRAKEEEQKRELHKKNEDLIRQEYAKLNEHLNEGVEDIEDYDDVVFAKNTPYSQTMLDIALTLPQNGAGSASRVLYKLGKNPQELQRFHSLHPLHQMREMHNLSRSLEMGGKERKGNDYQPTQPIKNNPTFSSARGISEDAPMSAFKKRAREGWR